MAIYSNKNEPSKCCLGAADFGLYPDMHKAYNNISNILGHSNFILTNGCENAFRIALQILRPQHILIESPSWTLPQIIASAFDIPYDLLYYHTNFKFNFAECCQKAQDTIYLTNTMNNLFIHDNIDCSALPNHVRIIEDYTYTMEKLPSLMPANNKIIIGSFSKTTAPGMRLGILICPPHLLHKANMLREQYVNTIAAQYAASITAMPILRKNKYLTSNKIMHTDIYDVYRMLPDILLKTKHYKQFMIDQECFYRVGKNHSLKESVVIV